MAQKDHILSLLGEFLPDAQAIEFREPPRNRRFTLYALLALIVVALSWASFSEMDKLVIARGRLITPIANLVVQPLEPGILKSIDVRVGQVVKKGAVLATLDQTFTSANAGQLGSRSDTLSLRALRIESELLGLDHLAGAASQNQKQLQSDLMGERQAAFAARLLQFEETIGALKASVETTKQNQKTLLKRVHLLKERETMQAELVADNYASRAGLMEIQESRLSVEQEYDLAINKEKEFLRQIASAEAEKEAFVKSWRLEAMEKLSETIQQRDEVAEELSKALLRAELVTLIAPQDSIVLEIAKLSVGSVIKEAEPMFVLVPVGVELEAEVEVSPSDVGQIRTGDDARIKIDAYPFQKHGTVKGKVVNISADTFMRRNAMGGSEYYYLARVSLEETHLEKIPAPTMLLPGMTLTSEVLTGKRKVISYFLYPVIRTLDESFRER